MRIISGIFRGRKLKSFEGKHIRPTTGRLRESIFSALDHRIGRFPDKRVADIFSGTGALGLESLSRGAKGATFVENDQSAVLLLKENIGLLGVKDQCEILALDALKLPAPDVAFDVIFMDPPYGRGLATPAIREIIDKGWLSDTGVLVLECDQKEVVEIPAGLKNLKTLKQGFRQARFYGSS